MKKFIFIISIFFLGKIQAQQTQVDQTTITGNQSGIWDVDPNQITVQQPSSGIITISPSSTYNSTLQIAPTQNVPAINSVSSGVSSSPAVNVGGTGVTEPTLNTSYAVGTLEGTPSVGTNGAANYSIPIPLPPGTHDMAPKLNLSYNSNLGEGIMGMGWSLGLSSIIRVNQDIYHDLKCQSVALDDTDVLSLDGNRMYVSSGTNLTSPCVYRLEDENYTQITYKTNTSGTLYFLAETKQGIKMEYGSTADSKLTLGGTPYEYFLNKVYDNFGNYISYTYNTNTTTNEVTLKEIDYTINDGASIGAYNSVLFYYDVKDATSGANAQETKIIAGKTITK